jgi:pimeloyl-ACP methyl ester carboxylesterase
VSFTAAGEQVTGAEFGTSGTVGIVLAHEYMSNLCGWVDYAQHLRDLGYRALAFDFGAHLVADVNAAADELRHEGATRIVLIGASMGGTASLMAASPPSSGVAAVAALSAPSSFMGLDGAGASSTLSIPVLYMASHDNGEFPGDAQAMYSVCPSAHKQLQILSGSDHGTALLHGAVAAQAQSLLDKFLAASIA